MRETPKNRAQHTKTGNSHKQAWDTAKHCINSTDKHVFDEQTVYSGFFGGLGRGK